MRRVVKVTKAGRAYAFSALVVVGSGEGSAGFAVARARAARDAIAKAMRRARADLVPFDRFAGHTLYHDVKAKYGATQVLLRAAPEGRGIVANRYVGDVCKAFGLQNVVAKVYGSRTPANVVRATFKALANHESSAEVAARRGKRVFELK